MTVFYVMGCTFEVCEVDLSEGAQGRLSRWGAGLTR